MTWWAIDLRPAAEVREPVGAWLVTRTGAAVEERPDGSLTGFAPTETAADAVIAELAQVHAVHGARRAVAAVDWSTRWRDGLAPRAVGRLTLAPSWSGLEPDGRTLIIDPESAFGSGEHGSTRTALALVDRVIADGDLVLDLGSGSGILTIAAVRLGGRRAVGLELDADAVPVAEANARRNGVAERVAFIAGDAAALAPLVGPADLVVSNILRSVNTALLPVIRAILNPGGRAAFAGMEEPERPAFLEALRAAGFEPGEEHRDEGWWGIVARSAA